MAVIITNPNLRTALNKSTALALYVIYRESHINRNSHKYISFIKLNKNILTCYCDFMPIKTTVEFELSDDDLYILKDEPKI